MIDAAGIRTADPADRDAVVALWRDAGLVRPWNDPLRDYDLALSSGGSAILVALTEERIIGSAMVGFDGHRGWIYYLAVASAARRRGVARSLMAACEAWLRERGAPKLQLMVREDNEEALGFYAALGLEPQKVVTLGRFLELEART